MRSMVISPPSEGKGRAFQALCLAAIKADCLWPGGETATQDFRPVWVMFAGSDNSVRPFVANLTLGRKAEFDDKGSNYFFCGARGANRMEILRSAKFQTVYQRETEGTLVTSFLPDLFKLDPGMVDVSGIRFIVLPTREWFLKQTMDVRNIVAYAMRLGYPVDEGQLATLIPISFLFAAYLDRRTRCPLLSDDRFYIQLLLACLSEGLASWGSAAEHSYHTAPEFGRHSRFMFYEYGTADVGLLPGIACKASHEDMETMLAAQVQRFFDLTGGS